MQIPHPLHSWPMTHESTFDFQNLVKLEFNPPKTRELSSYVPKDIQDKMERVDNLISKGESLLSSTPCNFSTIFAMSLHSNMESFYSS